MVIRNPCRGTIWRVRVFFLIWVIQYRVKWVFWGQEGRGGSGRMGSKGCSGRVDGADGAEKRCLSYARVGPIPGSVR